MQSSSIADAIELRPASIKVFPALSPSLSKPVEQLWNLSVGISPGGACLDPFLHLVQPATPCSHVDDRARGAARPCPAPLHAAAGVLLRWQLPHVLCLALRAQLFRSVERKMVRGFFAAPLPAAAAAVDGF